jgi:hypothetical protein
MIGQVSNSYIATSLLSYNTMIGLYIRTVWEWGQAWLSGRAFLRTFHRLCFSLMSWFAPRT